MVPGVAYLFVSNAQLHICHLPLTCHYKTGSGFQFLAKLFDTSACLPQKYSNSILCFFVYLQVCANYLCFLAPNCTKTEVFTSRYIFMFPHPPHSCKVFKYQPNFLYLCLFISQLPLDDLLYSVSFPFGKFYHITLIVRCVFFHVFNTSETSMHTTVVAIFPLATALLKFLYGTKRVPRFDEIKLI